MLKDACMQPVPSKLEATKDKHCLMPAWMLSLHSYIGSSACAGNDFCMHCLKRPCWSCLDLRRFSSQMRMSLMMVDLSSQTERPMVIRMVPTTHATVMTQGSHGLLLAV